MLTSTIILRIHHSFKFDVKMGMQAVQTEMRQSVFYLVLLIVIYLHTTTF